MTSLERLVLSLVFDAEQEGDALYFYSETGPRDWIGLSIAELRTAYDASAEIDSVTSVHVQACLADADPEATEIELDLSTVSWDRLLQDIVRRSPTLDHVTAVAGFTCSKMRADGFGGMAMLITADAIQSKSTHDILAEFLVARAGKGGF